MHIDWDAACAVSRDLAVQLTIVREWADALMTRVKHCNLRSGVMCAMNFERELQALKNLDAELASGPSAKKYRKIRNDVLSEISEFDLLQSEIERILPACMCIHAPG